MSEDKLGCGGHMGFLVRLKSGSFDIKNAFDSGRDKRNSREKETLKRF